MRKHRLGLPTGPTPAAVYTVASKLVPASAGSAIVENIRYFGFYQKVIVRLETGETLQVRKEPHHPVKTGDHVEVTVKSPVVAFVKNISQRITTSTNFKRHEFPRRA